MHNHLIEMTNITTNIRRLVMTIDDDFLIHFILHSLSPESGTFQVNYNTIKDRWSLNELSSKLIHKELRLKNQGGHSLNLVKHEAGKKEIKRIKKKGSKKDEFKNDSKNQKKERKVDRCHFCKKPGHFHKRRAWFENKGKPSALLCFESNLTEVPYNTWWLDSCVTTHICNTMQGFLTIRTTSPNENFVFMGNRIKALVKGMGTYCLILNTDHNLDLLETLYVPSISCNLVSLSKLDISGFIIRFGERCFSLYKNTIFIGSGILSEG
ncbi:hypothetical protein Patl1_04772 [Pistacia atlantica]|uniref:Uncharacterized protein n=1 Tax=Pistacia atlantica TaxID=434234 RepID=A0ACC1BSZ7_9ROSI|nr:hypothetical protein Patl1_04772 [Pistacia atlantica]